jgi:tRNA pseudouridine55 synthase
MVLVDKPVGPTSHDVVEILRHALGTRQVGHMGTLDPLATGLLLMGVGEGTKLTQFLLEMDKRYECTARLGARSTTYDSMGAIEEVADPSGLAREQVEAALERFRGAFEQRPPSFSAIKVQGRPLYDYARKGEEVERKPRRVRVHELTLWRFEPPEIELRMHVSSGTYVRSIVHDLGEALGVGAYVTQLRRTSVGPFDVRDALRITPEGAVEAVETLQGTEGGEGGEKVEGKTGIKQCFLTLAQALGHWRQLRVPDALLEAVRNGGTIAAGSLEYDPPALISDHQYALVDDAGRLVAVARCLVTHGDQKVFGNAGRGDLVLKPLRIFHDA